MTDAYDFRGKTPEEAIRSVQAIPKSENSSFSVLLDNPMVASRVRSSLTENGCDVSLEDDEGTVVLKARLRTPGSPAKAEPVRIPAVRPKKAPPVSPSTQPAHPVFGGTTIILSRRTIGGSDEDHGENLALAFLQSLQHVTPFPQTIVLMNEGVKLAVKGTKTCASISSLNHRGCRVLVSRDCLAHFGIEEVLGVGSVVSLQDITATLLRSERTLSL